MAASKKLCKFLKKFLHIQCDSFQSIPRNASATSNSFDISSLGSSGRSWCSITDTRYDSEGEWLSLPPDVPAGCLPVYVGKEQKRFVIPTSYLNNGIFRALLAKSEEEYGFKSEGGLRIACTPEVFQHLQWWLEGVTMQHVVETELVELDGYR